LRVNSRIRGPRPALAAALLLAGSIGPARAGAEPLDSLALDLYARANPLGLSLEAEARRRWVQPDGEGVLAQGRHVQAGALLGVNAAWTSLGPRLEWIPIAPLQLLAGYDAMAVYGANGSLLRLPGDDAPFGASDLSARRRDERSGLVQRAFLTVVPRLRVGRLVLRSSNQLLAYRMAGAAGTYYESEFDTLLRERDLVFQSRTAATWEAWRGAGEATLLAGPVHELTRAVRTGVVRQRAGGVLYFVPWHERWGLSQPRLVLLAGLDLQDRNRRGQPFVSGGIGFDFR
jgi:hypothetical protein